MVALLAAGPSGETFAGAGRRAETTLLHVFYAGSGLWRKCDAADCATGNQDWGNDSLTYTVALGYRTTHDTRLLALLRALVQTAPAYAAPCPSGSKCGSWSDVPEWDAVALVDEYEVTHDPAALAKAEAAVAFVEQSGVYALGACPRIDYQQPNGGANMLKTLETDANAIKAALLLYRVTQKPEYLDSARRHYAAVREYFLDPVVPLYTVYVFDDGSACTQLPHRFFASVNGDMIWSGVELFRDTSVRSYLDDSVATAKAVDRDLADGRGVFADLQAENDVVEPLVEGMDALAARHEAFARAWILRNAGAALSARAADGAFGRFFDGPAPATTVTDWQTNGGLALEIAAASLAPTTAVRATRAWAGAKVVPHEVSTLPATIVVRGSAVALLGTLGEQCCEAGHARVLVDGRETYDETGIWQNKSSLGRSIDGTVLFAWRWRSAGTHTLTFEPGVENGKEGGSFLHLRAYELLDASQRLMSLSIAWRSISASSSGAKSRRASAPTFISSCSTLLAPMSADVTRRSRSAQARASCASVCPRPRAISSSARMRSSASSLSSSGLSEPCRAARESCGTPCRYLSVSIPCASGEKTMQPTPSSSSASSSSASIQRLSIEYEGWWIRSGVPRAARIACASRVLRAE
jgi:hypothetical protein